MQRKQRGSANFNALFIENMIVRMEGMSYCFNLYFSFRALKIYFINICVFYKYFPNIYIIKYFKTQFFMFSFFRMHKIFQNKYFVSSQFPSCYTLIQATKNYFSKQNFIFVLKLF